MIFSSKPALIAMERMMTQPPFYRPPGHGKYQPKKLPPGKAHYNCEYCLHYDRKEKCKLIQCPYMDERIKAGAVSLTEALIETMKDIHNTAFRKRFNKMLMKSEERKMFSFRSEVHRVRINFFIFLYPQWQIVRKYEFPEKACHRWKW